MSFIQRSDNGTRESARIGHVSRDAVTRADMVATALWNSHASHIYVLPFTALLALDINSDYGYIYLKYFRWEFQMSACLLFLVEYRKET